MFKFLKPRREESAQPSAQDILATCETETNRVARAMWQPMTAPRDINTLTQLLQAAVAAGLEGHEVIQRLDFLKRLLAALAGGADAATKDALLAEAVDWKLESTHAVGSMAVLRDRELLTEGGPKAIGRDLRGRAVYLQCPAQFNDKPGQIEVREDGVTFTGDVVVEIRWSDVVHAAKTSHAHMGYEYAAVAFQEGNSRVPTIFAFPPERKLPGAYTRDAYACDLTVKVWQQSKSSAST